MSLNKESFKRGYAPYLKKLESSGVRFSNGAVAAVVENAPSQDKKEIFQNSRKINLTKNLIILKYQ
jgi:hypothetical protein